MMSSGTGKVLSLLVTAAAVLSILCSLSGADEVGEDEGWIGDGAPSRSVEYVSQSGIIVDGYQKDKLWAVAYVQNNDYVEGHAANPGDTDWYRFRQVANSFAIRLDGTVQSSGPAKRSLVEMFTATDCVYCPGAEESLNVTVSRQFPQNMTLIEWHRALEPGADPYETGSSGNRFNSYNISGTPMVIFDGQLGLVGGAASARPPQFVEAYEEGIRIMNTEEPMVSFAGSGKVVGNLLDFNVSFTQIAPMPRGNWVFSVILCEDLQKLHNEAMLRHTQRLSYGRTLPDLQAHHPTIGFDTGSTFSGLDMNRIRENLTIKWTASDPEDGTDVAIDVQIREPEMPWRTVLGELSNTGTYTWDTMSPRLPDGNYYLRLVATDKDGNAVLAKDIARFRLDNKDVPIGRLLTPLGGESLSNLHQIKWEAEDDEDDQLRVRVSISNDTGTTWRPITYDPDHDDYIADVGFFTLNTLFYDDLPTYMVEVDLRDVDGMGVTLRSDVFEIYNNDRPVITLSRPSVKELFTGKIVVSYRAEDEEDGPEMLHGLVTAKRREGGQEKVLLNRTIDVPSASLEFPTNLLYGDGEYELTFNVTDSRGLRDSDQVEFSIYDPDPPVILGLRARANLSNHRVPFLPLEWEARDDDTGEEITFSIYHNRSGEFDDWTLMAEDIKGTDYNLSLADWTEGMHWVRLEAMDSSSFGLTGDSVLGPVRYDPYDRPEVAFVYPGPDFTGTIEGTMEEKESGTFSRTIIWEGSDRDGDGLVFGLYFKGQSEQSWKPLITQTNLTSFEWNMTSLKNGSYQLRLTVMDDSVRHLSGEAITGPFTVRNPFDVPVIGDDDGPDDDVTNPKDDGSDTLLMVGLIVLSVLMVVVITGVILFIVMRPQRKEYKVMPEEGKMDLSIPEFERESPKPMMGYTYTPEGMQIEALPQTPLPPAQAPPSIGGQMPDLKTISAPQGAPLLEGQKVSWDDAAPEGPADAVQDASVEGPATQPPVQPS